MKTFFKVAKPIWGKGETNELNSSLFFRTSVENEENVTLRITANNFYRIYVDGKFYAYGPSRDAHDYYRVDTYPLSFQKEGAHVFVFEVSGYNCNSFYALNSEPFLQCEIENKKHEILRATGKDFEIFENETRIRKVTRFSYQRAFSESYNIDGRLKKFLKGEESSYRKIDAQILVDKRLDERIVDYPKYAKVKFSPIETGKARIDENKKIYEDRYQFLDYLKIFPKRDWEIDSNKIASQLSFKKRENDFPLLKENDFVTYSYKRSLTGFLYLKIDVYEDSLLYILFDEVNIPEKDNPNLVGISFCRNTTHNCVTYSLKKGSYNLLSFEPYTLMYVRLVLLSGRCKIKSFDVFTYENPETKIRFAFHNPKINSILNAAKNTFAQNALDLLTDCPSRERAGWLCDSFFSGQAEPLITGSNKVEEAFLDNYSKCKKDDLPEGMIPMCYPADFPSKEFIPNWSLWYILELYNCQERNGYSRLIENSKSNICGILGYFEKLENEFGLLENLQGWVFVEWSKANDPEFIRGINFPSNMLYADALIKAGYLLKKEKLIEKGKKLKETIRALSFQNGFFVDNAVRDAQNQIIPTKNITETCQYYALFFDVIKKEDDPIFFEKMVQNFGEYRDDKTVYPNVYKSNVLMGIMMRLSVLNRYGYDHLVFKETIDYFYKMSSLTGTLWEHDSVFASLNHCFTSYIINIFLDASFGLKWIDNKKKVIHMSKKGPTLEGRVSLPLGKQSLTLSFRKKNLLITKPDDYKIEWN